MRSPWTLGLAPLSTDTHDWLENDYYAVSPFQVKELGRAKLRIIASHTDAPGDSRVERLEAALRAGQARFTFEVRPLRGEAAGRWYPLAELRLVEQVELNPVTLRFWPFRDGRGLTPVGFVHAMRLPTYRQSQEARALHSRSGPCSSRGSSTPSARTSPPAATSAISGTSPASRSERPGGAYKRRRPDTPEGSRAAGLLKVTHRKC